MRRGSLHFRFEMDKIHKECIRKNLVMLCEKLTAEPLHTHLMVEGVFNEVSMQYIKAMRVQFEQNQKLCFDLLKRGPDAFHKFVKCLFKSRLEFIGERLLVSEHNCRYRANLTSFSQLPTATQQKYRALQPQGAASIPHGYPQGAQVHERLYGSGDAGPRTIVTHPQSDLQAMANQIAAESAYLRAFQANDAYRMSSSPRGRMLIINNKSFPRFEGRASERRGTDIDATKLKGMFVTFGFHVTQKDNLTSQEMYQQVASFASAPELSAVDCAVVAILTHGGKGSVLYGTDGDPVALEGSNGSVDFDALLELFNARNCPALKEKPKFFIIQACRGDIRDTGELVSDAIAEGRPQSAAAINAASARVEAALTSAANQGAALVDRSAREAARGVRDWTLDDRKIPTVQDFLIAYATVPGYFSWRHTVAGSWFIQALCKVFEESVLTTHVLDMLVKVNGEVARYKDETNSRKQIPQPVVHLVKKWFLNPIPPESV